MGGAGELVPVLQAHLKAIGEAQWAALLGASRSNVIRWEAAKMRLYARELRKMTIEEIESALIGFTADVWENWPDEGMEFNRTPGKLAGLAGWIPQEDLWR